MNEIYRDATYTARNMVLGVDMWSDTKKKPEKVEVIAPTTEQTEQVEFNPENQKEFQPE